LQALSTKADVKYADCCSLGCDVLFPGRCAPTFRRNVPLLSSGHVFYTENKGFICLLKIGINTKLHGITSQKKPIKRRPLLTIFTFYGVDREQWQPKLKGEQFQEQFIQN
jgi:hypothetical protein